MTQFQFSDEYIYNKKHSENTESQTSLAEADH